MIADLTAQLETLPAITAERDGLKASIANFLATDNETRAAILADAAKSEKQKALEAAQADLDAAKAKLEALSKP